MRDQDCTINRCGGCPNRQTKDTTCLFGPSLHPASSSHTHRPAPPSLALLLFLRASCIAWPSCSSSIEKHCLTHRFTRSNCTTGKERRLRPVSLLGLRMALQPPQSWIVEVRVLLWRCDRGGSYVLQWCSPQLGGHTRCVGRPVAACPQVCFLGMLRLVTGRRVPSASLNTDQILSSLLH